MAERPTPHSIAIATLIALYMDPLSPLQDVLRKNDEETSNKAVICTSASTSAITSASNPSASPPPAASVSASAAPYSNNDIASILLKTMQSVSTSVDGLVDLMISIEATASSTATLTSTSTSTSEVDGEFGTFCRQVCLGFDQLSFESMTRLWEALREEVEECTLQLPVAMADNHGGNYGNTGNYLQQRTSSSTTPPSSTSHWSLSPQQSQELLRLRCLTLDEEAATKSPEELSLQASSVLLLDTNEIPAKHFLHFLNHLQRGSRVGALDALHRYFDYAMIAERKVEASTYTSSTTTPKGKQQRNRQVILHYATLLLAAVHYEFGNVELSQTATQEAIHVAQQSGDPACVAHALSFLHLTNTSGDSKQEDILQRCAVRALQGKLRKLVAGANLTVATQGGASWEALANATTDQPSSSSAGGSGGATTTMDRPTHMEDLSSPAEAMEILGQTSLVAATIWERMGVPSLSSLTTEIGLECYGKFLTKATKDAARQSVARSAIAGGPLVLLSNDKNLCRYGIALLPLAHAGTNFGTARLLHEWAVRRGEYGHAQTLLHYLYSRLHPGANYNAYQMEVTAQHALLLSRQGWVKEASTKYQELVDVAKKKNNLAQQARFLIQMAVTLLDANKQEFRAAVRPLRACLKLTGDNANMDAWHATATSIMALVHYRMTKSNIAIAMIKGVLPTLRQHTDDVWFVGEAYLTLTKCFMKRKQVDEAMDALDKSCCYFLECQDFVRLREVYFWQARLYDLKNDEQLRDESSQRFVDVSQQMARGTLRTGLGEIEDSGYMERMARRQVHHS